MSNSRIAEIGKATRFKPGCPPGPGRPRRRPITERYGVLAETLLDEELRVELKLPKGASYGDAAALAQFRKAIKGDTHAIREIREAVEGKKTIPLVETGETIVEMINASKYTEDTPEDLDPDDEPEEE